MTTQHRTSTPLSVTVVIPTKNRPKLLREAIASLDKQTELPDEILILDDGSLPPVALEIEQFPQIAERIDTIRVEPSQGAAHAKSEGVRRAKSDLVAFLDDDDLYDINYIREIKNAFIEHRDLDIIFVGVHFFSRETEIDQSRYTDFLDKVIEEAEGEARGENFFTFSDKLLSTLLLTGVPMAFQRPTLRREIFEVISDYKNIPYWDVEWALQAARSTAQLGILYKELYQQRVGSQQAYSDGDKLRHCKLDVEMKRLFLKDLNRNDPLSSLAEHALAQSLLSLSLLERDEGMLFPSFIHFLQSQKTEFNPRSFKMLLGYAKRLFQA